MSVCKNEKQIQIGKVPSLNFKLFLFLQKWGWTANWRIQIFSERLACSILENIFNPCRESKTLLQFQDSQFEKWRHNFFGGYFESILSTRQFFEYPGNFDLQNDSKQFWSSFKHLPVFSSCSKLKSRAYNIAFAKYRAGQWNFSSGNMATVVRG